MNNETSELIRLDLRLKRLSQIDSKVRINSTVSLGGRSSQSAIHLSQMLPNCQSIGTCSSILKV
jgi:hypothetical protein